MCQAAALYQAKYSRTAICSISLMNDISAHGTTRKQCQTAEYLLFSRMYSESINI